MHRDAFRPLLLRKRDFLFFKNMAIERRILWLFLLFLILICRLFVVSRSTKLLNAPNSLQSNGRVAARWVLRPSLRKSVGCWSNFTIKGFLPPLLFSYKLVQTRRLVRAKNSFDNNLWIHLKVEKWTSFSSQNKIGAWGSSKANAVLPNRSTFWLPRPIAQLTSELTFGARTTDCC